MSAAAPSADGRANPWLDAVRAMAIGLVLLRHGQRALSDRAGEAPDLAQTIALNGWIGVDLFFVLSGYLISRHLLRAGLGTPGFAWGRYLTLRALRIVPAYYAALLIVVAGTFPLFPVAADGLAFRTLYHLLFLQDYLLSDINVVFWSLGVEEKFYLVAPVLILALLGLRGARARCAMLALLFVLPTALRLTIFVWQGGEYTYPEFWRAFRSPFHMSLEGFVIGIAIALGQHEGLVQRSAVIGKAAMAGSLGALITWTATHDFMAHIGWADVGVQPPMIALLCGGVVLGSVMCGAATMPGTKAAQAVARLSYTLYLMHYPLLPLALAMGLPYGPAAFWALYLVLSFAAALALHIAVERPFLMLKDMLAKRPLTPRGTGAIG